jgi:hypothetical protein
MSLQKIKIHLEELMDDLLDQYLKNKYGENYQQKAESDYNSSRDNINTGSVISSIGAALANRDPNASNDYYNQLNKQAKEDTIGRIAADKSQFLKDKMDASTLNDLVTKQQMELAQKDPNARQSLIARALAKKYNLPVQDSDSFKDVSQFMDPRKMMETEAAANVDFDKQKQLRQLEHVFKKQENEMNRSNDLEKIQLKNELERTKGEAGAKLPSSEAGNLAKSTDALKDVMAFRDSALSTNDYSKSGKLNPLRSIPGTEDYTKTRAYENQAKAMMQKIGTYLEGGKLTDQDFESKYLPMAPAIDDPPSLKKAKMDNLEKMVKQRLNAELDAYGKAGYNVKNFSQEGNVPGNPVTGPRSAPKTVRVTNGSETLEIPIDDLQHAKADGYNVVGETAGR